MHYKVKKMSKNWLAIEEHNNQWKDTFTDDEIHNWLKQRQRLEKLYMIEQRIENLLTRVTNDTENQRQ